MPREPRVLCSARGARRGRGALRRCPPRLDVQRFVPRTHGCDVSSLDSTQAGSSEPGNQFRALLYPELSKEKAPRSRGRRGSPQDAVLFCIAALKRGAFLSLDVRNPISISPPPTSFSLIPLRAPKRFLECLHCSCDAGTQSPSPKELRATPVRQVLLVSRGHPKRSGDTASRRGACVRNRCLRKTGSLLQTRG